MINPGKPKVEKKPYLKPTITEVRLVAEEAVLGLCKDNSGIALTHCQDTLNCSSEAGS